MTDSRFSKICPACTAGRHRECSDPLCGCIVVHDGDNPVMRGFKLAKQRIHPERAAWTKGGFSPGSRALDIEIIRPNGTKGTKMTDQAQSTHDDDDEPVLTGETHPNYSPDEAETTRPEPADDGERALTERLRVYAPTGNLRDTPAEGLEYRVLDPKGPEGILMMSSATIGRPVDIGGAGTGGAGYRMAMHLAGSHEDATAMLEDPEANADFHREQHAGGGCGHEEGDLSWDPARAAGVIARARENDDAAARALNLHMTVHLASAHDDGGAWHRDLKGNEAAHLGIRPHLHRHTEVQHRYERALVEKIEADAEGGTLVSWAPAPHPPHTVLDMARTISGMHEHDPGMSPGTMAVDLAWIKTSGWPWHRRLLAGLLLAFSVKRPPSGCLDRRTGRGPGG